MRQVVWYTSKIIKSQMVTVLQSTRQHLCLIKASGGNNPLATRAWTSSASCELDVLTWPNSVSSREVLSSWAVGSGVKPSVSPCVPPGQIYSTSVQSHQHVGRSCRQRHGCSLLGTWLWHQKSQSRQYHENQPLFIQKHILSGCVLISVSSVWSIKVKY